VNERAGEAGFTLIEMVLAMTILGLVIGAISAAMFLGLGTERDVQTRLSESNSANLLASYFGPDVQQSGPVAVAPAANDSPYCGASGGAVALLLPQNNNASSVSYFVDPTNPKILRRRTCAGGAPTSGAQGIAVVRNLSGPLVFPPPCGATCTKIQVTQLVGGKLPYTTTLTGSRRVQ
jgi:prepilin-type N-terminal cleavage/methylation domain-containing protein